MACGRSFLGSILTLLSFKSFNFGRLVKYTKAKKPTQSTNSIWSFNNIHRFSSSCLVAASDSLRPRESFLLSNDSSQVHAFHLPFPHHFPFLSHFLCFPCNCKSLLWTLLVFSQWCFKMMFSKESIRNRLLSSMVSGLKWVCRPLMLVGGTGTWKSCKERWFCIHLYG